MTRTTTTSREIKHMLHTLLELPDDSPLEKALNHYGARDFLDINTMPDRYVDRLNYPNDTGKTMIPLPEVERKRLKLLREFVRHHISLKMKSDPDLTF